ncbi:MAG: hypothetical protein P1U53_05185 [Sulfitobacter sp.]|nr:hypothetical protein [Sulfitobacter sp.]
MDFWSLVSLIFYVLAVVVLARADGWRIWSIGVLLLGVAFLPIALVVILSMSSVTATFAVTLISATPAIAMLVIFALAKSVSNRLKENDA